MKNIVIIGNGISGITAARHIRKQSNHRITVISSETKYFYSRTALMYVFMGHLTFDQTKPYEDFFWKKNRIDLLLDQVVKVKTDAKRLHLRSGDQLDYDILIIATGSHSNKFDWPGQDLSGVQGLYSYPDLQVMADSVKGTTRAVIVGGGLIGVEMAEMLHSRNIEVTILVREAEFWNNVLPLRDANLISRHLRMHQIDLRLGTMLQEAHGDSNGRVHHITTDKGEQINCQFVGLTVGVSPEIGFLKDSGVACQRGVLVDEYLQTNVPDVYAIGDCVERTYDLGGRSRIEQVWYTGRMMGEVVAQTICGDQTPYSPGPWFNSAKFFDIEYQTYGYVKAESGDDESDFYWEDVAGTRAVHVVWQRGTNRFVGINTFGIRMRHDCFDRWLREDRSVQYVVDHLEEANFDPEFFPRFEKTIRSHFKKYLSSETMEA
jgi:NAD(P)H-nitrite reductase large subunit